MAGYRQDRINDSVAKEMAEIVREIKDPRVSSALITVTGAEVTKDLKYAKVFYSVIAGEDPDVGKGLSSAAGFARGQLARRLNLRVTPEISFVYDGSLEHGMKIAKILNELDVKKEDTENGENDGTV
ncbi:MAG: 30S ribosome-binding factor RbfA [Clostridia bacterium]|nr:30S ribosome-binding factor RbfA [Clostridia bacterium]